MTTSVTVRAANADDVSRLREIATAAYSIYVERIGCPPAPMTADYDAAVAAGETWVAEHDGRVIALLVLRQMSDHLLLENVAVEPAEQGTGVGRRLLQFAEGRARAAGLPEVRLYTNEAMTENLAYYPRHGYRVTHRAEDGGFRRVFFTKPIG